MNNHINWRQAFLAIGISWLVYLILCMTWAQAGEFVSVPVIITVCALAARFHYVAAPVAFVLVGLFMLYVYEVPGKVIENISTAYIATRDPLVVALEKTETKMKANVGRKVDSVTTDIDSSSTRLSQTEKDSILDAAKAYRENKEFFLQVAETAGVAKSKPKSATAPAKDTTVSDTSRSKLTYSVRDEQKFIVQVPPHHKVALTATTAGYICDPSIGLVPSIEGMDYYPDGMQFKEGFPARNARVFCLLATLDDQQPQAFVDGACTLYNDTDDTLDCYVLMNDRNDWSDNTGSIQITQTLISL